MTQEVRRKKVFSIGNYLFTGITLGKGNFARVEEAVHTILNVRVAIKIMDVNHIKEEYVIKNLYREAKIMAKLNHPCIVSLFQTMQRADNVYYLVTELANGGDLCSFVKKQAKGRLEEKLTKVYARQFVSALSHMHSLGVVHRDLKMDNVMLNSVQTQIKIVDFGLSNIWTPDSPLKTHCGSPEYAAPELFVTGKQYGAEVDLWSLGIILYGMVLGKLPFVTSCCQQLPSQERRKQLVAQINKGLSTAHRRALSSFSPDFRTLMSRLLIADASKRINIKELMVHPWITEKGKRMIRTNPLKNLDSYEKNKLYGKLSAILQIDPKQVSQAIMQEPLGKVGGVYNVLKRKLQLNSVHGDGASKTMPSLTIFEIANLTKALDKERSRSPLSKRIPKPQSAQTQKKDYFTPSIQSTESKVSRQSINKEEQTVKLVNINTNQGKIKKKYQLTKSRPSTVQETTILKGAGAGEGKERPNTVQAVVEKKVDYRYIKSPSLRRKVYSATLNKDSSQLIPVPDKCLASPRGDQKETMVTIEKPKDKKDARLKERVMSPSTKSRERDKSKFDRPVSKKQGKVVQIKESPAKLPPLPKSDQSQRRTSVTAPLQQMIEKSLKTAVVIGKSSSAKVTMKKKEAKEDNVNMAFGDYVATKGATSPRKIAIYDPIARSIADYVANNISDKINRYPWLKK
ncbi:unnamed protein product [Psylliodes chrysocephalus]|uniref:Protein kinase domain-containing protein n=1 Tax=Psylliodes chrysocephalus TaxID=3402493 RepID=A0A9P0GKG3_9CUCU|nr:unnamed protein product [Psylliodes chrysocephala]